MSVVRGLVAGILCAAALATAGCGSSGSEPARAGGSPSGVRIHAGDADNGTTLHLSRGADLEVTLASTYWTFTPASPAGVVRGSTPTYQASAGNPPGTGRGTVRAGFEALAPGTATITATRTSCGEALRCTGGAGLFRLTVVVR